MDFLIVEEFRLEKEHREVWNKSDAITDEFLGEEASKLIRDIDFMTKAATVLENR